MPFLTDEESEELRIERMILHVVGNDREFTPQPELQDLEQAQFFLERIKSAAASSTHLFNEGSPTKALITGIHSGQDHFVTGAQELARRFAVSHGGNSTDGAFFFVALRSPASNTSFYALIKYDYREAIELYEDEGRNALRQIIQAFVKERAAMQKFCLVAVRDGAVEPAISASDRMGRSPDLTDYFTAFLDAHRNRSEADMSRDLKTVVRKTLQDRRDDLPGRDVAAAERSVHHVLRGQLQVDEDAVKQALFFAADEPEDEHLVNRLSQTLHRKMKTAKLDGISFRPDQAIFTRPSKRRIRTSERVVIDYPGELDGNAVRREAREGGGWVFTVTTSEALEEDGIISDGSR